MKVSIGLTVRRKKHHPSRHSFIDTINHHRYAVRVKLEKISDDLLLDRDLSAMNHFSCSFNLPRCFSRVKLKDNFHSRGQRSGKFRLPVACVADGNLPVITGGSERLRRRPGCREQKKLLTSG